MKENLIEPLCAIECFTKTALKRGTATLFALLRLSIFSLTTMKLMLGGVESIIKRHDVTGVFLKSV